MSPRKVVAVAGMEFRALTGSGVFRLSLVLVPLFSLGLAALSRRWEPAQAPGPAAAPGAIAPVAAMCLLFLMVMLTTPPMMSAILEEKMGRISEMLLAAVAPFDLMLGKLLACCAAAALVGALYLPLGLGLALHYGYGGLFSPASVAAFLVFLALAVFLYGSLFMAIGAACSQPKDAQGMLAPLLLIATGPLFFVRSLLQAPGGRLAVAMSQFPLSAPFVMGFRMQCSPPPSAGEVALSIAGTLLATAFCVWAAARIFRVGLLSQGKTPGFRQLWRWVFIDAA